MKIISRHSTKKQLRLDAINNEINRLVQRYRDGDSDAGQLLLTKFEPIIRKYKTVLWSGILPRYDPDVRRFLSFFNSDKKKAAELLSKSIKKNESEEDLDQLLNYCLLKTAIKYNKISAGFKFILKEEIVKLTKDVSTHRTTLTSSFHDNSNSGGSSFLSQELIDNLADGRIKKIVPIQEKEIEMNRFVTDGSDMKGFNELSQEQRLVCKMAFIDGFTNEQIASSLEIDIKEIKKIRSKIREILKRQFPEYAKKSSTLEDSEEEKDI